MGKFKQAGRAPHADYVNYSAAYAVESAQNFSGSKNPDTTMPLELKVVSEHADLLGDDCIREFHEDGGTIGRSLQNDWILPDPDRYISGRHCAIDFKGGIYYLADTSSNGVYVNDEAEPIGKGNPRRLFNGDKLRMGDFVFQVSIDQGESLVMPLDDIDGNVVSEDIEEMVDEDSLRTGVQLLDEEAITGDDEFQSALFGNDEPAPEPELDFIVDADEPEPEAEPEPEPQPLRAVNTDDPFEAFLDGLGFKREDLHPTADPAEVMAAAGRILQEAIKGYSDLLASRASLKDAFRLDQTTMLPRHNNPLKFSEKTDDLLRQLLVGGEGDYLGAADSVREVAQDLLHHQNAFIDAMNSAFIEFSNRFDPAELQDGFDQTLGGGLFSFMNKSKYWQLYCDVYPILTEKGSGRFPQMFGEEFVEAYERQIAEYRRRDRAGVARTGVDTEPALMVTQKLEPPAPEPADEPLDETAADEIDQSFIEELENSMAEEIELGRRKA